MDYSVMFFSGALATSAADNYAHVLKIAEYADAKGLAGLWIPERHFSSFGSPYPNPALLLAALSRSTRRLKLRAGSIVAPLHHPLRLAEDLSMLDHLSFGRVEAAFASGWHPNDFALAPGAYDRRREQTVVIAEQVRALLSGEGFPGQSGSGQRVCVYVEPQPIRQAVPLWLTAAQSRETFVAAGRLGYNLLTHVLDPNLQVVAENIEAYRAARAANGLDPSSGRVALMLHTFLTNDPNAAVQIARAPYKAYLRSIAPMAAGMATARARSAAAQRMTDAQVDQFIEFQFQRILDGRSLIGTVDSVRGTVLSMARIGVDEIACLVDFGLSGDIVFAHLPHLAELARDSNSVHSVSLTGENR